MMEGDGGKNEARGLGGLLRGMCLLEIKNNSDQSFKLYWLGQILIHSRRKTFFLKIYGCLGSKSDNRYMPASYPFA